MRDNKTSQPATEYDDNIYKTMPFYDCFHDAAITLVETARPSPAAWLDAGCGTGSLILKAASLFPATAFTLSDPSEGMLEIARDKVPENVGCTHILAGTEDLQCPSESFDVITAILAHHYLDLETRRRATVNCFRMLKKGGIYVTFETMMPNSEQGKRIGLDRWRMAQIRQGKDEAAAAKHILRFGVEYFPISLTAHLELLKETGFSSAEVLWVSGMQGGFYAVK